MKIPDNHQRLMPYLILKGAAEFIHFMKDVFGAEEISRKYRDEKNSLIMHAELRIGDNTIMLADSTLEFMPQAAGLFIYVEDADAVHKKAVAQGGKSVMDVSDQSYGRSGGVRDPFGNSWWITSHPPA